MTETPSALAPHDVLLAQSLRQFAQTELLPGYSAREEQSGRPHEPLDRMASLGLFAMRTPEQYGGIPSSFVTIGVACEEIARGDHNMALFIQLATIASELISSVGSTVAKSRWLPHIADGSAVFCLATTEPNAGSDMKAMSSRLTPADPRGFSLSGEKASVSFAGIADACIVFARTGDDSIYGSVIVDLASDGVSREVYDSFGQRLSQRGSLVFNSVAVPEDALLGELNDDGLSAAASSFDFNRALISLACVGAASQSIDETAVYVQARSTFGRPLSTRQSVSFQLADHTASLYAARLIAYECLRQKDLGLPCANVGAMAKLLGPRAAADAIHTCILLHGWLGYDRSLPHQQRFRDVVGMEIGDGTAEMMRGVIARGLVGTSTLR